MDENQPSYYSQFIARAIAMVFCVDNAKASAGHVSTQNSNTVRISSSIAYAEHVL